VQVVCFSSSSQAVEWISFVAMLVTETSYFTAGILYTSSDLWDDDGLCEEKERARGGM